MNGLRAFRPIADFQQSHIEQPEHTRKPIQTRTYVSKCSLSLGRTLCSGISDRSHDNRPENAKLEIACATRDVPEEQSSDKDLEQGDRILFDSSMPVDARKRRCGLIRASLTMTLTSIDAIKRANVPSTLHRENSRTLKGTCLACTHHRMFLAQQAGIPPL